MATDFPIIDRGTQFGQVPARQWQNLIETVKQLANLKVGQGLSIDKPTDGWFIGLDPKHEPTVVHRRRVILVREPAEGDRWLDVRGVRYLDQPPHIRYRAEPPQENRYQLHTEVLQAYPVPGSRISDFVGAAFAELDEANEPVPVNDSAVFLDAYWERDAWYVHPPIFQDRFVVCRQYAFDDPEGWGRLIVVQEVEPELGAFQEWTGALRPIGDVFEINVWPTMKAADFAPFLWVPEAMNDETTILPLTFWRGAWWLKQRPKRAVSLRRGPLRIVDCQPVEAPA